MSATTSPRATSSSAATSTTARSRAAERSKSPRDAPKAGPPFAELLSKLRGAPLSPPGIAPKPLKPPAGAPVPTQAAAEKAAAQGAKASLEENEPGARRELRGAQQRQDERDEHDPSWLSRTAQLAPPLASWQEQSVEHVEHVARHGAVEELAPQLLRKFAWSGDGQRGSARLEIGEGALSGAVLVLHADGKQVKLEVDGLNERDTARLRERLDRGLRARGFALDEE